MLRSRLLRTAYSAPGAAEQTTNRRRRLRRRRTDSRLFSLLVSCVRLFGGLRLALRNERVVFLVTQISDVYPGVRHFVDRTIPIAHPLIRIGVVLVGPRVVVPRRHVYHGPLWEYRGGIVGVDVVRQPVEVEVADIADDLRTAVRQNGFDLHRLSAQMEVGLEVL